MEQQTIFRRQVLVLIFDGHDVAINTMSCEELRHENRGHRAFVRDILETTVIQGHVYDDSPVEAYRGEGAFVFYLPYTGPKVNRGPLLEEIGERLATIEEVYARSVGRSRTGEVDVVRTAAFLVGYVAAMEDVQGRLNGKPWKEMTALKDTIAQMKRTGV